MPAQSERGHIWDRHALGITVEKREGVTVVAVSGEIDVASVAALRERLVHLATEGCVNLVLDLTEVSFLDSAGLGALIATRRKFKTLGGLFVLACDNTVVLRLLTLTCLDRVVPVYPTVEEAIAGKFSGSPA